MKIAELHIDSFGICTGLRVKDLSPTLNVFYGQNEAGKTTLMQFIRSVLYGFSAERRSRYLPPGSRFPAGGAIVITEQGHTLVAERKIDGDGYETDLHLSAADGQPADAQYVARLLRDVDERLFNAVFAIGLRDLQELGTLSDTSAGDFLFRVAAGVNGASLFEVMTELENLRNRLLAIDDRPCEIVHLLGQQDRLRAEIHELEALVEQYAQTLCEQREIEAEVERLRADERQLREQLAQLQLAQRIAPAWQRRMSLDSQLNEAGPEPALPENALQRLETIAQLTEKCRLRLAKYRPRHRRLALAARRISLNEALWREASKAEAFCDQQEWIATLENQLDAVQDQLGQWKSQLDSARNGGGWAATGPAKIDPKAFIRLKAAARQCAAGRKVLKQAAAGQTGTQQALAALEQQIAGGLANNSGKSLSAALEESGNIANQLRRRLQLDESAEQLAEKKKELEAERLDRLEHQVIPAWAIGGMAIVFALGVLIFLAGLILPLAGSQTLGLFLAGLGLVGAIGVVTSKYLIERHNQGQLELCERQLGMLVQQVRQNQEEREKLDKQLPSGGGPLTVRLQAAEKALAQLEDLIPLDARRQGLQRDLASTGQSIERAKQELARCRSNWKKLVVGLGLPADFAPRQLRTLAESTQRLDALQERLAACQEERDQREQALLQIGQRLRPLLALAGIDPTAKRISQQLAELRAELSKAREAAARRQELQDRQLALRKQAQRVLKLLRRASKQRRRLMREAGVKAVAELRRLADRKELIARLHGERLAAQAEIDRELAGLPTEAAIAPIVEEVLHPDRGTERASDLTHRIGDLEHRISKLLEQRGALTERLKTLVADRRLPARQLELGVVQQRLYAAVQRWQVLAITWAILNRLRTAYEQERQPETLKVASAYFARLTSGKYRKVWTPLGERVLCVEDEQGHNMQVDVLSRGTREQLFLALRLAMVKLYARRDIRLPLVLDDLLVNFDAERSRAAAIVLKDFADEGHQLIVFTCHEHIARLFHSLHIAVRSIAKGGLLAAWPAEPQVKPLKHEQPVAAPAAIPPPPVQAAAAEPEVISASRIEAASDAPPRRAGRPIRKRERDRMPAAAPPFTRPLPKMDWNAEEFDGEFAERHVQTGQESSQHPLTAEAVSVGGTDTEAA